MNINLSLLLTALAIFINFSLVQTRPELFVSETVIETQLAPELILTNNSITIIEASEIGIIEFSESSLLLLEKFYTVFPSDIPPPLS